MAETLLDLGSLLTPYSARGLSQSLEPIAPAAVLMRTINGALVDLSDAAFQKYASTVQCGDMNAPALDGLWPGALLTVDCLAELSYLTAGGAPARTVVAGSSRVEGAFTFYRPRLSMRVLSYSSDFDELSAGVAWQLSLEEV